MNLNAKIRTRLLICSALAPAFLIPSHAMAQDADAKNEGGLEEIVVTAQKREQSLQDVPIAVTALSQSSLEANRIVNVGDLSSVAPNVTVRPAAGGTQIAMFTVRGVNSYGVAPGSDKEVSINLDGVYISSARGSIFDIADIERIEMLRGPQGTLFGRNATAGAISIMTRGPSGNFGVTQSVTVGNYKQLRSRTTVDFPAVGPFSAYVTYVHNERRGEVKNQGAGTVWDYTGPGANNLGKQVSPDYLGSHNSNAVFAAVKFEPSDNFKATYKFDWTGDHYTPEANILIGYDATTTEGIKIKALMENQVAGVATTGSFVGQTIAAGVVPVSTPTGKRIDTANNWWTIPGYQRNSGHNLTMELRVSDDLSIKSITGYRTSYLKGVSDLTGLGGLVVTPAAALAYHAATITTALPAGSTALDSKVGNRYLAYGTIRLYKDHQFSEEVQVNYTQQNWNLTAGAIYFTSTAREAGPDSMFTSRNRYYEIPNATGFIPQATGTAVSGEAIFNNRAKSFATYGQLEVHVTPTLDFVGGIRVTWDTKDGDAITGGTWVPNTPGSRTDGKMVYNTTGATPDIQTYPQYTDHQPSYSVGLNYKPSNDLLIYAKYARSYVSGGQVSVVSWKPEIAKSWEAGVKSTMLDGHLRTNLAVFNVTYDNLQTAQGGASFFGVAGFEKVTTIPVIIVPMEARVRARGFEFELTAAPMTGVTVGGSVGYTDVTLIGKIGNAVLQAAGLPPGSDALYAPTLVPAWTANSYIQYESSDLGNGARMSIRLDGNWRDKMRMDGNIDVPKPVFAATEFQPATLILNGRVAITDLPVGPLKTTLALWGRNLTDNKNVQYRSQVSGPSAIGGSFTPARTFGLDLTVKY